MNRLPKNAALAAALLLIAYAAAAMPAAQSSKAAGAQKKQQGATSKDQAKPAEEQPPAEQKPQPSGGLLKVMVRGQSSTAQNNTASAGFRGVKPDGAVDTTVLAAAVTESDKQKAAMLST